MNNINSIELLKRGFVDKEIDKNIDLFGEIEKMRKDKNAVILAHYYQEGDIQDIADFVGDSLALSQKAADTDADIILFAGVHFMAETAKILASDKKVLIPDLNAGCSLAESCPADEFVEFKKKFPDHTVISYINTTAEIKALTDITCTRNMVIWDGACHVHEEFSLERILELKKEHPDAKIIAHPECQKPILIVAEHIGSTSSLLKFTDQDKAQKYIVATESGIIHQMKKNNPQKMYIPAPPKDSTCACSDCRYMKLLTIKKLYNCLKYELPEVIVDEEISRKAVISIKRMLEISARNGKKA